MLFLLIAATALVLGTAGCSPLPNNHTGIVKSPPDQNNNLQGSPDINQNINNGNSVDERMQWALDILFAWQPQWEELESQGKRPVENGYATMVITAVEEERGIFIFHVFDIVEYPEEGHSSTYGWYEVNIETGEIYDSILNERVY